MGSSQATTAPSVSIIPTPTSILVEVLIVGIVLVCLAVTWQLYRLCTGRREPEYAADGNLGLQRSSGGGFAEFAGESSPSRNTNNYEGGRRRSYKERRRLDRTASGSSSILKGSSTTNRDRDRFG